MNGPGGSIIRNFPLCGPHPGVDWHRRPIFALVWNSAIQRREIESLAAETDVHHHRGRFLGLAGSPIDHEQTKSDKLAFFESVPHRADFGFWPGREYGKVRKQN